MVKENQNFINEKISKHLQKIIKKKPKINYKNALKDQIS